MPYDYSSNITDPNNPAGNYGSPQGAWDRASNVLNTYNDQNKTGRTINWDAAKGVFDQFYGQQGNEGDWINSTWDARDKWLSPGTSTPQPASNQQKQGYDLEAFRKRWMQSGDINNAQGWLDSNRDITGGVTLRNEKAYDPSGRFIADLVGNFKDPNTANRSRIFLDGIGSNGRPRTVGSGSDIPAGSVSSVAGSGAGPAGTTSSSGRSIAPITDPRLDTLYNTLLSRSQQGLNIGRNDPIIRGEADAYAANEERAKRNYLADLAEKSGPLANLRGEERLAAERVGQRTGAFEASLMSRELQDRRDEIADALRSMQGLLTDEQELALREELAQWDNEIRKQSLNQQDRQYYSDLDYRDRALSQADSQFLDRLGFDYADRSNYWDSFWRGARG